MDEMPQESTESPFQRWLRTRRLPWIITFFGLSVASIVISQIAFLHGAFRGLPLVAQAAGGIANVVVVLCIAEVVQRRSDRRKQSQ